MCDKNIIFSSSTKLVNAFSLFLTCLCLTIPKKNAHSHVLTTIIFTLPFTNALLYHSDFSFHAFANDTNPIHQIVPFLWTMSFWTITMVPLLSLQLLPEYATVFSNSSHLKVNSPNPWSHSCFLQFFWVTSSFLSPYQF